MKPFALVCFDCLEIPESSVRFELDIMVGVENYFTVFPGVFLLKKSISAKEIAARFREIPAYKRFIVVDFDREDAGGVLPRTVVEEIRNAKRDDLF